jgi:hypothetical protein
MKQGTLVWVLAEVSEFQKDNNREGTIIVEPMGYKALPYYANVEDIKEVPLWEIDELENRYEALNNEEK